MLTLTTSSTTYVVIANMIGEINRQDNADEALYCPAKAQMSPADASRGAGTPIASSLAALHGFRSET
jgi:hypothetical protein